ncbi:MAG: hypothetical protein SFU84_00205 [Gemmatimonadales bacterium]|nr:hypothetical protein [Gemmatimonadales bacterium]
MPPSLREYHDVSMTQRERMLVGKAYDSRDPELLALAQRARALRTALAGLPAADVEGRADANSLPWPASARTAGSARGPTA